MATEVNYKSYTPEEATNLFRLPADRDLLRTKTLNLTLENPANAAAEAKQKKEAMRQYFHATWEIYEKLYECLKYDEAYTVRPVHKLRHPMIFYIGHTATFYMNKLCLAGLTTRIDHKMEETFAIGVDEMSWDDLNEAHYDWPAVSAVWQYRRAVRARIDELFNQYELPLPLTFDNSSDDANHAFFWGIMMGCEHERIHLETASVHVRELPLNFVRHVPFWDPLTEEGEVPKELPMVEFAGGKVKVGRDKKGPLYGWDCDYSDGLVMEVSPFKAAEHLISNAEFFEFVKDGGYADKTLWDEEGWNWVSWKKPEHPWFWVKGEKEGEYMLRALVTVIPMKWSWPAEVNNLEAHAYCQWLGRKRGKTLRMPTEAEWLHMRDVCLGDHCDQHEWKVAPGNINLEHGCSSCPVLKFKQGKLYDCIGNVWQHCETAVYPYKGYNVHPLYDDFSMPTFDGRHRCMKGGTWVSTGNEATRDARFAFRRHFFQYIGIRVVEGETVDETKHMKNVLGLDPPVDLAAHRAYSPLPTSVDVSPKEVYPKVLADFAVEAFKEHAKGREPARAMDLLCGAGRASYEIAMSFKEVIGVDFSARMLQPAYAMRERGMATYSVVTDVATGARRGETVMAEGRPWAGRREDVMFYQSDPANLHAHLTNFDLVLAFNIMDQNTSYNPRAVPAHLLTRINAGGIIVVAEPTQKVNANAPSTADYIAALGDAAEVVAQPRTFALWIPDETEEGGKTVNFDVFVARRK